MRQIWRVDGVWILETAATASHTLPIPTRAFSTAVTPGGPSDVWTVTDGHWTPFCLPKLPALRHILHSLEPGHRNVFLRHLCNPKGQIAQPWKTVEILTLAINAYKLGNLSCFIMLSPATRQHWRPLIGKTKDKWLTVPFSNLSISSRALCPSSRVPHVGLAARSCDCIALKMAWTVFELAQTHLFHDL